MAGNRRGKLKEHFEGIHRNFDWIIYHVNQSLDLIGKDNPALSKSIRVLGESINCLDDLAQSIYNKL